MTTRQERVAASATAQYLASAKRTLKIRSDYRLAKHLSVTHSRVSSWRTGRCVPNAAIGLALARIVGVDPSKVIAELEAERAARARSKLERQKLRRRYLDDVVRLTRYGRSLLARGAS